MRPAVSGAKYERVTRTLQSLFHMALNVDFRDDAVYDRRPEYMIGAATSSLERVLRELGAPIVWKPWRLADDVEAYGDRAGRWIITTDDGEFEHWLHKVYDTEEDVIVAVTVLHAGGFP